MTKHSIFWVYILYCENDTYYTGYTTDMKKRYQAHLNETGRCKYTRSFKPLRIAQCWKIKNNKSFAMKMEARIKKLSRTQKEELILNPNVFLTDPCIEVLNSHEVNCYANKNQSL